MARAYRALPQLEHEEVARSARESATTRAARSTKERPRGALQRAVAAGELSIDRAEVDRISEAYRQVLRGARHRRA